ncbi:MAG: Gfo/Idh/MocA family oxidoreductase [Sporolactobacillus sp.]
MEVKTLNVGIIGCGKITQIRHLPEYANNPHTTIAGYFDYNQERAEELAKKYGGKVFRTLDALLADSHINAVSVCVANEAHAAIAIKALQAGKDVLCEKPMATSLEDCEQMVAVAKKCNRRLMIDQNQRLAKSHVFAKRLLDQNLIGDVLTFKTTFGHGGPETWSVDGGSNTWFFDKSRSKYGAIFDLGVHKLDLILYMLESTVANVSSRMTTLDKRNSDGNLINVDDNAISIYELKSGVLGTVTASWTYYGEEDNSTVLYGTKGLMKIYDDPKFSIVVTLRSGEKIYYDVDRIQTNDNQTSSGMIDQFVDSVLNDHASVADGETVLKSMRAIFASVESSQTGKRIEVDQLSKA